MKQDNQDKKEATASLIKRLTTKQLIQDQYRQREKFKTAQDRRTKEFFKEDKTNG